MKSLNIRVAFSAIDKLTRPVNAARQSAGGLSESLKKTQSAIKNLDGHSRTFNRLRESVQKTSRQIDEASKTLAGLNKAQREGTQLTDRQREHMAALAAKLERLNATRTQEMTKLRAASQALKSHGVSLAGSDRTIQSAIRRTEQYNQTLERQRQRLAAVTQARARHDRMQQAGSKLRGGGTMAVAGATAAGYAGGRFLAPAVGFDAEMSRVQALTRLDKGDSQLGALRDQAKKLGAETAFTTRDAASGQAFLAMAGFTPQAIQAALPGVLNMALAGGMELGESADIGSNVLAQFSMDASEMDRVSDVLTGAFTRTNTDLRQLGETMVYAGPVMSKLGIEVEKAAAMAGVLANNGIRGSMAGTAMRASLARLASPTKRAQTALDELGVSVADSTGKMLPIETLLTNLFNATKKFGETDQISFFKDIAGEEAFVGLQTLVQGAGTGALQKLIGELKQAQGEASKAAKVMADNLGGDLKELDSAWEGLRIQVEETTDGALRKLTQGLSDVITNVSAWVKENPRLTQSLILAAGSILTLTAAVGGLALALGLLTGPFAKLQLGFTLLTGGRGLGGTIKLFSGLGSASGSAMARIGGWSKVFSGLAASAGRLPGILAPLRSILLSVFMSPGVAVGGLVRGIGGLALRLTGLPALWGMITGAVSGLGGALSFLLSPIGLIGAAFVIAGLLIWRYWQPIKAFFSGVLAGIMEKLAPLRESFSRFSPIFDAIGNGVSAVFNWFKRLLSPVESSKDTLDKCASAGAVFGNVLGGALQLVLTPAKMLLDTLAWILEKLGVLPDEAERARKKIEDAQRMAVLQDKVALLQGDLTKVAPKKTEVKAPAPAAAAPLTGNAGTQRRLQKIADNTGGLLDETKKRIGPGDIVFKNLPRALAVRGEWKESRLVSAPVSRAVSPAVTAASLPVRQRELLPVSRTADAAPVASSGFTGDIHVHLHGVESQDARELGRIVADAVSAELARRGRLNRGSFRDRD
ncbi:phage tail tape measure protein [Erwinia sp. STN24]|uniref:phage tail tape measure protein n=1 Tax=Erwinia sp. STN24 TaxID=3233996 RepID=UPI0035203AFE